jgi:hypothetical protein
MEDEIDTLQDAYEKYLEKESDEIQETEED